MLNVLEIKQITGKWFERVEFGNFEMLIRTLIWAAHRRQMCERHKWFELKNCAITWRELECTAWSVRLYRKVPQLEACLSDFQQTASEKFSVKLFSENAL